MGDFPEKCEGCGSVIPEESPLGFCPRCVFSGGAERVGGIVEGIELGRRLGEGGFGEVFEGFQQEMPMGKVAVKIAREGAFSRGLAERFQVEMQVLALMDHPGITRFLESGKTSCGRLYYTMEYVEGRDLGEWGREEKRGAGEILEMMEALCEAVAHAHQRGVLHRDLKAENVLVPEVSGRPKIIDFGIARVLSGPLELAAGVSVEGWVGSPHAMSPEQLEGDPRLDVRVDVYALGLLFYEICLGKKVLDGVVRRELSWAANAERVGDFSFPRLTGAGFPREWDWVGERACAGDREARYGNAAELLEDFRALRDGGVVMAGAKPPGYLLAKAVRRHWVAVSLVGMALVSLAVMAVSGIGVALNESDARRRVEDSLASTKEAEGRARRDGSDALMNEGISSFREERYEVARRRLREALELWPGNADARYSLNFLESTHRFARGAGVIDVGFEVLGVEEVADGFLVKGAEGREKLMEVAEPEDGWDWDDVEVIERPGSVEFLSKETGLGLLSPLRYGTGREQAVISARLKYVAVFGKGGGVELWDVSGMGPSHLDKKFDGGTVYASFVRGTEKLWVMDGEGGLSQWEPGKGVTAKHEIMRAPSMPVLSAPEQLELIRNFWWLSGQGSFRGFSEDLRQTGSGVHLLMLSRLSGKQVMCVVTGRDSDEGMAAVEDGRIGGREPNGFFKWLPRRDFQTEFLAVESGGKYGAVLEHGDRVTIIDPVSSNEVATWLVPDPAQHIVMMDGGEVVVLAGDDGFLRSYDALTGEPIWKEIRAASGDGLDGIRMVVVPGTDELLVSVPGDLQIQRWNVRTGERLSRGMLHEHEVFWFGCLPGGEIAVSVDQSTVEKGEAAFRVWSLRSGNELVPALEFPVQIVWPAVCPDGKRIAMCLADRTVRYWNVD